MSVNNINFKNIRQTMTQELLMITSHNDEILKIE